MAFSSQTPWVAKHKLSDDKNAIYDDDGNVIKDDEANVRLIAAAPELLEALKAIIDLAECEVETRWHDDDVEDNEVRSASNACAQARAAIARVTKGN